MIVKMDKYSIILLNKDLSDFLKQLQSLGVVDVSRETKAIDTISVDIVNRINMYREVLKRIKGFSIPEGENDKTVDKTSDFIDPIKSGLSVKTLAERFKETLSSIDENSTAIKLIHKDMSDAEAWGNFDRDDIDKIEKLGFEIKYFTIPEKNFNSEWLSQYYLHILNNANGKIYFIILNPKDNELKFKLSESKFPEHPFTELKRKEDDLVRKNSASIAFIAKYRTEFIDILEKEILKESCNLDLHLAKVSSKKEAEESLAILTGFAPVDHKTEIENLLESTPDIYYISEEAVKEDKPPIKLKNNFFAKRFEVIGELYMMPKYGTLDLTPFFAPFYMLFFGMCLGDLGYGLILLLAGTVGKFKFKEYRQYLSLIQFLGIGSIVMPLLSGTLFGAKIYDLFPIPDNITNLFLSDIEIFWFAILFGVFQIVVARVINATYRGVTMGWQHSLSGFGWAILIIILTILYAGTMVKGLAIPDIVLYSTLSVAGVCILFFSSTEGNIFVRFGKGLASLYDITGIFGDVLSYIRLFGLGLAGGILGLVVNSVAMIFSNVPYIGWLFTIIVLFIGHTAVLLLSSLGAFVHPMRLTFVEFYKNADFDGGGKTYRPLSREK